MELQHRGGALWDVVVWTPKLAGGLLMGISTAHSAAIFLQINAVLSHWTAPQFKTHDAWSSAASTFQQHIH